MKKILILIFGIIIAVPALSQTYVNPLDNSKHHFVFDKDVTFFRIKPGVRNVFNFDKGVNYFPAVIVHDGDTGKRYQMEITLIDLTPTAPTLKETINDNSTRVIYTGTWVKFTNQTWTTSFLNNDVSVTSVVNSAATVTFTGKKVSVIAELRENHGVAKIEVKQGTTVIDSKIVDMYKASVVNAPAEIYSSGTLAHGTYTITVSLSSITTGRDSMVLDSFLIFE